MPCWAVKECWRVQGDPRPPLSWPREDARVAPWRSVCWEGSSFEPGSPAAVPSPVLGAGLFSHQGGHRHSWRCRFCFSLSVEAPDARSLVKGPSRSRGLSWSSRALRALRAVGPALPMAAPGEVKPRSRWRRLSDLWPVGLGSAWAGHPQLLGGPPCSQHTLSPRGTCRRGLLPSPYLPTSNFNLGLL